jgi:hypothetical protein
MKKLFNGFIILISTSLIGSSIFFSCRHMELDPGEFREICFESEILPVFQQSCGTTGCHNGSDLAKGYNFTNYNGIMQEVTPGKPFESLVYTILSDAWGEMMPPEYPLSQNERTLIRLWIEQGAVNNGNCDIDPVEDDSICFKTQILPILASSCGMTGCHDAGTAQEGIILTDYWNIMHSEENDLVVPGNPNESELWEKITETDPDKRMPPPPANPLSAEQKELIFNWIAEGALDRDCNTGACDTTDVTFSGTVWPIIQNNCMGCHSGGNPSGGFTLTNFTDVSVIASNNKLIQAINGNPQMPPTLPLTPCQIRQIEIWVENGAQNN